MTICLLAGPLALHAPSHSSGAMRVASTPALSPVADLEAPEEVRCATIAPDGRRVLAGTCANQIHVFERRQGGWILAETVATRDVPSGLWFSGDGTRLLGAAGGRLLVWTSPLRLGATQFKGGRRSGEPTHADSMARAADFYSLATAYGPAGARIRRVARVGFGEADVSLSVSPDGTWLGVLHACPESYRRALFYRIDPSQKRWSPFVVEFVSECHTPVAFSPDSQMALWATTGKLNGRRLAKGTADLQLATLRNESYAGLFVTDRPSRAILVATNGDVETVDLAAVGEGRIDARSQLVGNVGLDLAFDARESGESDPGFERCRQVGGSFVVWSGTRLRMFAVEA